MHEQRKMNELYKKEECFPSAILLRATTLKAEYIHYVLCRICWVHTSRMSIRKSRSLLSVRGQEWERNKDQMNPNTEGEKKTCKAHFINCRRQHKWNRKNTFDGYRYWIKRCFWFVRHKMITFSGNLFCHRRFTVILYAMTFIQTKAQVPHSLTRTHPE